MTADNVAAESISEAVDNWTSLLREKILFGLSVYPYLSPSQLHVFLGTATSTHVWKPILNELIAEGKVIREEIPLTSPHERTQTYTVLHLAENAYTFVSVPSVHTDCVPSDDKDIGNRSQ